MSTNWKAGDKALCVEKFTGGTMNPKAAPNIKPNGMPVVGVTYLVSGVYVSDDGNCGLLIAGLPCISTAGGKEAGWNQAKFRKIVPHYDRLTQEESGLIPHEGFWEGRQ